MATFENSPAVKRAAAARLSPPPNRSRVAITVLRAAAPSAGLEDRDTHSLAIYQRLLRSFLLGGARNPERKCRACEIGVLRCPWAHSQCD